MEDSTEYINGSPLETYWSHLFLKTEDFLFTYIVNSTGIPKGILSNSLHERLEHDFDRTFELIISLCKRLNDLIFIHIIEPSEMILENNSPIPDLNSVIYFYSVVISALFPFLTADTICNDERGKSLIEIFTKARLVINRYIALFKENDRVYQRICIISDLRYGLLKGVLNNISRKMSCLPLVQHFALK